VNNGDRLRPPISFQCDLSLVKGRT
jgi:hypothetical protein